MRHVLPNFAIAVRDRGANFCPNYVSKFSNRRTTKSNKRRSIGDDFFCLLGACEMLEEKGIVANPLLHKAPDRAHAMENLPKIVDIQGRIDRILDQHIIILRRS